LSLYHVDLGFCQPFSKSVRKIFVENQIVHILHPSYSPDLAPSDFWLFGHMRAGLAGQLFAEPEGLLREEWFFWRRFKYPN
jgi:hypothetical protein